MLFSDDDLARIYSLANNCVEGKRPPLTTAAVFNAMRAIANPPSHEFIKYIEGDMAYYIRKEVWERIDKTYIPRIMHIMQYADFAVNTQTNQLVKCRMPVEMLADAYCSIST